MSPSRLFLVAMALACGVVRCDAKPLSFNGVPLGQKLEVFLKAHPEADMAWPSDEEATLTRSQRLALEAKEKNPSLAEIRESGLFLDAFYGFSGGSLANATFLASSIGIRPEERNLASLKVPLSQLLTELGAPTAQGMTPAEIYGRCPMLVWKTPTQSAFARVYWPSSPEKPGFLGVVVTTIDAPWREAKSGLEMIWPAVLPPTKDDSIHTHQLMTLLEKLRPGSTRHIATLPAAPTIDLISNKGRNR